MMARTRQSTGVRAILPKDRMTDFGALRLGLCCLFVEQPIKFRTTTAASLMRLKRPEQQAKLSQRCLANAESLLTALQYCATNDIGCFRIVSSILPMKTHPQVGYAMTLAHSQNAAPPAEEITFSRATDGRGYRLDSTMILPQPRERVFEFFADAFQLETITPPWLHFEVVTPGPIHLNEGTTIDYRLRLHRIPIRWRSVISAWDPPFRFVDEQLRGPYRRWHHEHLFEETDGGTICRDIVHYEVPAGRLVERLFVRRDLRKIFQFRQQKLSELFAQCDPSHREVTDE